MSKIDCLKLITVRITTIISCVFLLTITIGEMAYGAGTDTINVEGKIVRNDAGHEGMNVVTGSPACVVTGNSNDTCDFRVRYYSSSTGGTLYLTETFQNIEIGQYNGGFNISLGSGATTAGTYSNLSGMVKGEDTIYMEISFSPAGDETYTEIFGRMPLQSSAYAIKSKYSSGASSAFQFAQSSDPSGYTNPVAGMVYFDTTTNTLKIYNGSSWEKISSGAAGTSLWSDGGTYTYLTDTADSFSLGSSSYTPIGTKSYADYILGLTSNPVFSFDMPMDRLSVWGDKKQTGLTVLSSYGSSDSWPLVTFQSTSANFGSAVLNVVQGGTGKIATFYKGSTEAFTFGSDQTFLIGQRTGVPSSTSDRLYNVGGVLYWNGSSICTLASGCGVTSLWSDADTYTYLNSTSDNLVLGGNSLATAKFFFDVTNGRLGIGTSSPTARVDIRTDSPTIGNGVGDLTIIAVGKFVVKASDVNPDNLQEWQNSVGAVLALINGSGYASFGGGGTGNSVLSLGGNTGMISQINLESSGSIDVLNPTDGDLWWNGTELYFFDGDRNTNLLTGGKEEYIVYGLVSDNNYLSLSHNQNTYAMEAQGYVCVGGEEDANCTGGQWKNISEWGKVITDTGYLDWYTADKMSSNVNVNTGDIQLGSNKSYGIYTSEPIRTTGAKKYGDISWTEDLGSTGKISVLTRSGTPEQRYEYMTDSLVYSQELSPDGKTLYIGGEFRNIYEKNYGTAIPIDITTGEPVEGNCPNKMGGDVYASISDGNGGWYLSGAGIGVETVSGIHNYYDLIHIREDCSLDPDFGFDTGLYIYSLYLKDNVLYVGGDFTSIGGQSRNRLAAIDLATNSVTSFNPNVDGTIRTMVMSDNILYIGGSFTSVGGQARSKLAGIDITTGLVTNFSADANDVVYALQIRNNILYVGGSFTSIGGQSRNRLAGIDLTTGSVTSFNPNANNTVRAMILRDNILFLGGEFTNAGGQTRNKAAAIDVNTGVATNFNPNISGTTYALAIGDGIVFLGGAFSSVGGKLRSALAAVDMVSGAVTDFVANFNRTVWTLQLTGNILYVGGIFHSTTNDTGRTRVGAIDTETGLATSFNPNANGTVWGMVLRDNVLFLRGDFTNVGGQTRNRIAAVDTTTGLATSFNPNVNGTVNAMLLSGNILYVGGSFTSIGGQSRNRLAAIDITTGLVTGFNANVNGPVFSLKINGGTLYVGGDFTTIGGQTRNKIGAVDATSGAVTDFNPNANGIVRALEVGDNVLYVGGEFTSVGGQTRNRIAVVDMATGLATSVDLNANNIVRVLLLKDTTLYIGGDFTTIGGQTRNKVATMDTTTGGITSFNPSVYANGIFSLLLYGNALYLGGDIWSVGSTRADFLAPIDITTSKVLVKRPEQWSTWSEGSIIKNLNNANDHTTWVGNGATVSDGTVTRSVKYFEDENESVAGNTTKVVSTSSGQYVQSIISSSDLSNYDYISMWVYSNQVGTSLRVSIGEDTSNLKNKDIVIDVANTWQKIYWDISGIPMSEKDGITTLRVTNLSSSNTFYIDNISAEKLPSNSEGYEIQSPGDDYIQYRVIFTNTDGISQPKVSDISLEYNTDYGLEYTDSNTIKMYNGSGSSQYLKIKATKGDTQFVSNIPDKGDAIAFSFNTTNSIINENTKLFSVNNSGTEKMYIDAYGNVYITGEVISGGAQYLKFSPTYAQTDGLSESNSIWINKTSTGGNLVKLQNNSTDMFVVNSTGDVLTHGTVEIEGGVLKLGDNGNIRFNSVSEEVEISKDGGSTWVKVGGNSGKIVISAEYAGAVLSEDGTDNIGNMTSDNTGSTDNSMNYYEWTSSESTLNDYDIRVRMALPSDFESWGSGGVTVHYATESVSATSNKLSLYIFEQSKTTVDAQQENLVSTTAGVWATSKLNGSDLNECTGSGTQCILDIKVFSSLDNYVRVGDIVLEYVRTL